MVHSLSRRSRTRRRMIIQKAAARLAGQPADVDRPIEPPSQPSKVKETGETPSESTGPTAEQSLTYLRELLAGDRPVTWVLTGDDVSEADADVPSIGALIDARIRRQWGRGDDHVVDTSRGDDSLRLLERSLHRRAIRFDPAAVFVVVGRRNMPDDQLKAELRALSKTLNRLNQAGIVPVVLPPVPQTGADELTLHAPTERLRRAVEKVARRRNAVLVRTAECDRPELLAVAIFRTLELNRRRPESHPASKSASREARSVVPS